MSFASERFAESGPNVDQVAVGTELREEISENLDGLSTLIHIAFVLRDLDVTENTR
jgi:hypothetical protein